MSDAVVVLVRGGDVITMDAAGTVVSDGAVVVRGDVIDAVGDFAELRRLHPDATVIGDASSIVTPGYVNGHQHLTGDRLVHSCIPVKRSWLRLQSASSRTSRVT
jgi:5-methylthioadenosine/S-adenosylhomocysteine deaminase